MRVKDPPEIGPGTSTGGWLRTSLRSVASDEVSGLPSTVHEEYVTAPKCGRTFDVDVAPNWAIVGPLDAPK